MQSNKNSTYILGLNPPQSSNQIADQFINLYIILNLLTNELTTSFQKSSFEINTLKTYADFFFFE